MADLEPLSLLEEDMLKEVFNLGIGQASASLSQLVRQEIQLSVPEIEYTSTRRIAEILGEDANLICVRQALAGRYDLHAVLLFSEAWGLSVVDHILEGQRTGELFSNLQSEALMEMGNIIINACVAALGELLQMQFEVGRPHIRQEGLGELLGETHSDDRLMLIRIELSLSHNAINGHIGFLLDAASFDNLRRGLGVALDRLVISH